MVEYLNYAWLKDRGRNIRVHGNRFIQIDLEDSNGVWGGERVHVWHDLVPLAQRYNTPIHDHVFGFHSRILAGALIDIRYRVVPMTGHRRATAYNVLTYDVYSAQPRDGSDTALMKTGEVVSAEVASTQLMEAGTGYMIRAKEFHTTAYVGYAVTRIRKAETVTGTPRVLCPTTMDPDNEFERYKYSPAKLWAVVEEVLQQAERERSNVAEGTTPV